MKPDRTVVTFAMLLIASLSLALPAACSSDTGANVDGGGGHGGAAATGSGGGGAGGTGGGSAGGSGGTGGGATAGRGGGGGNAGAGASGSAGTGGSGVDAAVPDTGTGACAGLHCGQLCNSCPPSAPLCPGAIAYCDANGACVIGSAPVCP